MTIQIVPHKCKKCYFVWKNITRQKYRLCGTLQRPFSKRQELRKYFSEKFSAAKIKKSDQQKSAVTHAADFSAPKIGQTKSTCKI